MILIGLHEAQRRAVVNFMRHGSGSDRAAVRDFVDRCAEALATPAYDVREYPTVAILVLPAHLKTTLLTGRRSWRAYRALFEALWNCTVHGSIHVDRAATAQRYVTK